LDDIEVVEEKSLMGADLVGPAGLTPAEKSPVDREIESI